jgi:PAS domain S-box-containing protein
MSSIPLNIPAVILSAIPALFAAFFLFMFHKDNDKRKLIAVASFAFMSFSSGVEIFGLPQPFYVLNNLYWWGDLPIIVALVIFFLYQMLNLKTFEKALKIFFAVFAFTLLILIIPGSALVSGVTVDFFGFVALGLSLYLLFRRRRFVDTLFLLSILSFDAYGYSWGTTVGVTFSLVCYAASFLFVGLALGYARIENSWDNASLFKATKQLDKAKERLKELEFEYKTVFESANDAIFIIDEQTGVILDCNNEATKLLGLQKEEIVNKNEKTLFPLQSRPALAAPFDKQATDASEIVELQVVTSKSELRDVAAKLGSFQYGGKKLLVGVFRDVTEQKKTAMDLSSALEYLSDQIGKVETLNEKLRVVGSLTRHDVRNKLMIANNYVYLLRKRIGSQPELLNYLEGIESSVRQCDKLFEFSRLYEQIGAQQPTRVNVGDCFSQAAGMIAKHEITVINKCQGLTVTADTLLTQLFYNLIDNSQKHGESVTQITLHFTSEKGETTLFYEDNGVGIPQENKDKIFSEGFTTGGSGLGLKLVKKMIEAYGWTITESGVQGKGAKFQITIPNVESISEEQSVTLLADLGTDLNTKTQVNKIG